MSRLRVTLVLATFGRANEIGRLLETLVGQTQAPFELLVVDQNFDDRVLPFVAQAQKAGLSVKHWRLTPANLSAARNRGIAEATGDVIAFPDDDCWYSSDLIEQVQLAFEHQPTWDGLVAQWVEQAEGVGRQADVGSTLSAQAWQQFRGGEASSISLFIKVATLRRFGGFDEQLGVGQWFGAGEETDLLLRMLGGGAMIGQWSKARVHHRFAPQAKLQQHAPWRDILHRARGTGAIYAKHRMSGWVILRGVLAPVGSAVWQRKGFRALCLAFVETIGRLQGACMWILAR